VVVVNIAMIAHELEPPEHLANGEEAEALGKENAASGHLSDTQVLRGVDDLVEYLGGLLEG
jgi:hypothetical protein